MLDTRVVSVKQQAKKAIVKYIIVAGTDRSHMRTNFNNIWTTFGNKYFRTNFLKYMRWVPKQYFWNNILRKKNKKALQNIWDMF